MVQIRFWPFVAKDILEMIGAKRAAIFPLRIAGPIAFANRDPMMPANRLPLSHVSLFEPRNYQGRFRFELAMGHVVIWQGAIKWVLLGNERDRDVIATV